MSHYTVLFPNELQECSRIENSRVVHETIVHCATKTSGMRAHRRSVHFQEMSRKIDEFAEPANFLAHLQQKCLRQISPVWRNIGEIFLLSPPIWRRRELNGKYSYSCDERNWSLELWYKYLSANCQFHRSLLRTRCSLDRQGYYRAYVGTLFGDLRDVSNSQKLRVATGNGRPLIWMESEIESESIVACSVSLFASDHLRGDLLQYYETSLITAWLGKY